MSDRRNCMKQLSLAGLVLLFAASLGGSAPAGDVPNNDGGVVLIDQAFVRKHKFPLEIDQPGTYRLTNSLTFTGKSDTDIAIVVSAPQTDFGVTIDLNGLTITGSGGGTPIQVASNQKVTVENGTLSNFRDGISGGNSAITARGVRIILPQTANGTAIFVGPGSIVTGNTLIGSGSLASGIRCSGSNISNNTISGFDRGIDATSSIVTSNTVSNSSETGIFVTSGRVDGNTSFKNSTGIFDNGGSKVLNNLVFNNSSLGIQGGKNSTYEGNTIASNGAGILTGDGSSVSNNTVSNNSGIGIGATKATKVSNNQVTSNNGDGISLNSDGLITGNIVKSNAKIGLDLGDATTGYLDNSIGNNTNGNVLNGTNLGGNLCNQGTTVTFCP